MDIHSDEAKQAWKNAGGKPADLDALRSRFGPGKSFAEIGSLRDGHPELAEFGAKTLESLRSFSGVAPMVVDEPTSNERPLVEPKASHKK